MKRFQRVDGTKMEVDPAVRLPEAPVDALPAQLELPQTSRGQILQILTFLHWGIPTFQTIAWYVAWLLVENSEALWMIFAQEPL